MTTRSPRAVDDPGDGSPDARPDGRVATQLELPWRTIVRVLLLLASLWLAVRLWEVAVQLLIALVLAAALEPAVRWLQRRRLPRALAVATVVVGILGGLALGVTLLLQPLIDESRAFADELPAYVEDGRALLEDNSDLYARLQSGAQSASADPTILLGGVLEVGQGLVGAVTTTFVVVVFTIYILVDGTRIYAWLVRYARADTRDKLDRTIPEVIKVINGYVVGQLLTSAVFGVFTFALLSLLDVPQPLFLAVVAFVADAIPIAGVVIATVPAVLLALTVSPTAAVAVLVAYLVYQQIENYVIVPRVYRSTLQISSFAVLVAVLIGGTLLGILGVLLALPAAAAVPAIEKIWVPEPRKRKADAVEAERIEHAEESTAGWPG